MKPKEGTILTVAKGGAERAAQLVEETDDVLYFMEEVIKYMDEVLDYTPELLPVLKEAGVVDSGGQGLMEIMKGAYDALCGKEVEFDIPAAKPVVNKAAGAASDDISTADKPTAKLIDHQGDAISKDAHIGNRSHGPFGTSHFAFNSADSCKAWSTKQVKDHK